MKTAMLYTTKRALTQFTARIGLRGAVLFGLFVGFLPALQGPAYVATYPHAAERVAFVKTLSTTPALGIMYGNVHDALQPEGYIVYRCLTALLFGAALWGLLSATKLFRGQEEDGRWELVLTGQVTKARALGQTMLGWLIALLAGLLLGGSIVAALGLMPSLAITFTSGFFFAIVVMVMAALFFAIGAFTSQLGATRHQATIYGLVPLFAFFVLRAVEKVTTGMTWLRAGNPFSWLENTHPIVGSKPLWILPPLILALVVMLVAMIIARRRDLGESVIAGKDIVPPRYGLLHGILPFSIRLGWPLLVSWSLCVLSIVAIIAAITKVAVATVDDSPSLSTAVTTLAGGSQGIALSFLSMATFFGAAILIAMAAAGMAAIRKDEAKAYADNILVGPVSRSRWLGSRIGLLVGALTITLVLASCIVWALASAQHISLNGPRFVLETLNGMGPIMVALGIGVTVYGWRPRFAAWAVYGLLLWSFVIDLITSTVKLNSFFTNTSLFHHIALTPAVHPVWSTFLTTILGGVGLICIGVYLFNRRDLEVE